MARRGFFYIRLAIGLVLLLALALVCNPRDMAKAFSGASFGFLALSLAAYLVSYAVTAWRWTIMLDGQGRISFWDACRYTFEAVFCNNFLPTGFGGDVTRLANMARHEIPLAKGTGLLFLERLIGFLVIGIMTFLASPALFEFLSGLWKDEGGMGRLELLLLGAFLAAMTFALAFCLALFFSPRFCAWFASLANRKAFGRIGRFLGECVAQIGASCLRNKAVIWTFLISCLLQIAFALAFQCSLLALHLDAPFWPVFALVQITSLLGVLPITFETAGTREFLFLTFLVPLGYDKAAVLTALLLARFMAILSALPGLVFIFTDGLPKKES